jgi:hypothetical protein
MNYRYYLPTPQTDHILAFETHHDGAEAVLIITYLKMENVAFMARELKIFQT